MDAQYLSEAALRLFQRRQQLSSLDTEGQNDKVDLDEAVRRIAEQRTTSLQSTKQTAAKQGLYFSGQLGKRLGDVETGYARQQGDMQRDFGRREEARSAARRAIEAGAPLQEAAAAAAAADRQITRDQEAADAGVLARNPAPKPKPAAKPKPRPKPAPARPRQRPRQRGARQTYRPDRVPRPAAELRPVR